jgi:hypothetical protein
MEGGADATWVTFVLRISTPSSKPAEFVTV